MLHEFLSQNRGGLIARCREKVAQRSSPKATPDELDHGVPFFLDQLIKTLQLEQTSQPSAGLKVSGPSGGGKPALSELGEMAAKHGGELMRRGFTIEQVVHDYGDLCQSITDLAFEVNFPVEVDEFRTLNRCLDNAIAMAVTEFTYQRDFEVADKQVQALNEQIGFLAHELRNYLHQAMLALTVIKEGNMGLHGATGTILDRAHLAMQSLINRSLTDVRITAGLTPRNQLFGLADFIGEVRLSASLEARDKGCVLVISGVDLSLAIDADRDLLLSAVGNLLQNAFKFTHPGTDVLLSAYSVGDRILIDVEDHGDGLPPGGAEKMFQPFTQGGTDMSGLGLGLSISRRSVEANDGILSVRNKSEGGCIFSISLPRRSMEDIPEAA
jgi:signal transduction histidine kinase